MEEILDNIDSVNKKIRNEILEKFNFFIDSNSINFSFNSKNSCFEGVSELANNKEYIILNKEYEYLNFIKTTINNFIKSNEEEDLNTKVESVKHLKETPVDSE